MYFDFRGINKVQYKFNCCSFIVKLKHDEIWLNSKSLILTKYKNFELALITWDACKCMRQKTIYFEKTKNHIDIAQIAQIY